MAQLSVYKGFTVSPACNPGFPGRLAPAGALLVLSCCAESSLEEQDEPWDDEWCRAMLDQPKCQRPRQGQ